MADEESSGRKQFIVEWNIPEEVTREKYDQSKVESLDIYPDVEGVEWKSTFLSDDMDKCYCIYEADDEEAVRRARDAVDTPIDKILPVDELTAETYQDGE